MKKALITGVTGQDGAYLAEFLLGKGYEVHGIKRRSSSFNTERIDHLYEDPHEKNIKFHLHYGDLTDSSNIIRIIQKVRPDEIYNLGAMSHVAVSFESPEYTANVDGIGTLRILEAVRILGLEKRLAFIKPRPQNSLGSRKRLLKKKRLRFIRDLLTGWLNFTPIGLRSIIVRLMACLPAMASCSTTSLRFAGKPL